jgi:hypothetical protein
LNLQMVPDFGCYFAPFFNTIPARSHSAVRQARERRLRKIEPPNGAHRDYLPSRRI